MPEAFVVVVVSTGRSLTGIAVIWIPDSGSPDVSATVADGAIIGQWLKHDGRWWNAVDPHRVEQLMTAVAKVRGIA